MSVTEQNIFVYNGHDRESRILAALVSHCDAERSFRFLPVDNPRSTERMHRFLRNNGLHPDAVQLPFVIMLPSPSGGVDGARSVVHGHALRVWLNGVTDALAARGVRPGDIRDGVILPHLSEPTIRLLAFAMTPPPPPVVVVPPQPAAAPVPPQPEDPADEPFEEEPDDERSRGMIVDGDTMDAVRSSLPTRKVLKKDKSAADMMAEAQQQIKAREQMQTRARH